ncbi:MAG: spore coat protein [Firmicutes bacterium]|nr:spore coat protein [Bacillota bacterium]
MNQSQKIQNQKTEVPSTIELNDKDRITDLLETEKNLNVNMAIVKNEASNEVLFQKFKEMAEIVRNNQRTLYELSFQKGWYSLEKAEVNKITEAYNKHQTCIKELSE